MWGVSPLQATTQSVMPSVSLEGETGHGRPWGWGCWELPLPLPALHPRDLSDRGSGSRAAPVVNTRGCITSLPSLTHRHKQGCSSHPVSSLISSVPLLSWAWQDLAQLPAAPEDAAAQPKDRPMHMHIPCTWPQLCAHTSTHPLLIVPQFFPSEERLPHEHLTHFLTSFWISSCMWWKNRSRFSWLLVALVSGR